MRHQLFQSNYISISIIHIHNHFATDYTTMVHGITFTHCTAGIWSILSKTSVFTENQSNRSGHSGCRKAYCLSVTQLSLLIRENKKGHTYSTQMRQFMMKLDSRTAMTVSRISNPYHPGLWPSLKGVMPRNGLRRYQRATIRFPNTKPSRDASQWGKLEIPIYFSCVCMYTHTHTHIHICQDQGRTIPRIVALKEMPNSKPRATSFQDLSLYRIVYITGDEEEYSNFVQKTLLKHSFGLVHETVSKAGLRRPSLEGCLQGWSLVDIWVSQVFLVNS